MRIKKIKKIRKRFALQHPYGSWYIVIGYLLVIVYLLRNPSSVFFWMGIGIAGITPFLRPFDEETEETVNLDELTAKRSLNDTIIYNVQKLINKLTKKEGSENVN